MSFKLTVAAYCGVLASSGCAQTDSPKIVPAPSPMEMSAQTPGSHITWSHEVGRMEHGGVRAIVTAVIVENAAEPGRKFRGVKVSLADGKATDEIYLDEEAIARTTTGLMNIAEGLESFAARGAKGCEGSLIFVVKFADHPHAWSKYHELDAAYCEMPDGPGLSLTGRNKPGTFKIPGETPDHLARMLDTAVSELKAH